MNRGYRVSAAEDAYGRQLGTLNRQTGFANQNATNTRTTANRDAAAVGGLVKSGGDLLGERAAKADADRQTGVRPGGGDGDEWLKNNDLAATYPPPAAPPAPTPKAAADATGFGEQHTANVFELPYDKDK